jgi:hypothetical protein
MSVATAEPPAASKVSMLGSKGSMGERYGG